MTSQQLAVYRAAQQRAAQQERSQAMTTGARRGLMTRGGSTAANAGLTSATGGSLASLGTGLVMAAPALIMQILRAAGLAQGRTAENATNAITAMTPAMSALGTAVVAPALMGTAASGAGLLAAPLAMGLMAGMDQKSKVHDEYNINFPMKVREAGRDWADAMPWLAKQIQSAKTPQELAQAVADFKATVGKNIGGYDKSGDAWTLGSLPAYGGSKHEGGATFDYNPQIQSLNRALQLRRRMFGSAGQNVTPTQGTQLDPYAYRQQATHQNANPGTGQRMVSAEIPDASFGPNAQLIKSRDWAPDEMTNRFVFTGAGSQGFPVYATRDQIMQYGGWDPGDWQETRNKQVGQTLMNWNSI